MLLFFQQFNVHLSGKLCFSYGCVYTHCSCSTPVLSLTNIVPAIGSSPGQYGGGGKACVMVFWIPRFPPHNNNIHTHRHHGNVCAHREQTRRVDVLRNLNESFVGASSRCGASRAVHKSLVPKAATFLASSEGMSLIQRMTLERASKFYCFEQADTEFGGGLSLEDVVFFHARFLLCFFFFL